MVSDVRYGVANPRRHCRIFPRSNGKQHPPLARRHPAGMPRRLLTCAVAAIAATTGHSFVPLASPAPAIRHAPPSSANFAVARFTSGGPAWATPTRRPSKHDRSLAVRLAEPTSPLEEKEEDDEFDEVCVPC